jgi:hypothetical protein
LRAGIAQGRAFFTDHRLRVQLPDKLPLVFAEPGQIERVLTNLVENTPRPEHPSLSKPGLNPLASSSPSPIAAQAYPWTRGSGSSKNSSGYRAGTARHPPAPDSGSPCVRPSSRPTAVASGSSPVEAAGPASYSHSQCRSRIVWNRRPRLDGF